MGFINQLITGGHHPAGFVDFPETPVLPLHTIVYIVLGKLNPRHVNSANFPCQGLEHVLFNPYFKTSSQLSVLDDDQFSSPVFVGVILKNG